METINIDVRGVGEAKKALNNLADKIVNPDGQLMRRLGDATMDDIEQRFMTRGYGTWKELSPSTIKAKRGNSMVLVDTGAMFSSLRPEISGRSVRVVVPYGGAEHNTSVPGYHQEGTRRMPQRKIVDFTQKLAKALQDAFTTWLIDMFKASQKSV